MIDTASGGGRALIVRVQTRVCAIPLEHVLETMRPLSVEPFARMPPFVRGVSIIRGLPTPVVDLGSLLGAPDGDINRFVTIRVAERQVALAVGTVLGIHHLGEATIGALPPVLQDASKDMIDAIGTLDAQILVVLRSAWRLPDEVWEILAVREPAL
jgi:purine-binding chemotaxis protein CheW